MWGDELSYLGEIRETSGSKGPFAGTSRLAYAKMPGSYLHNKSNVWGWGETLLEGDSRVKDM